MKKSWLLFGLMALLLIAGCKQEVKQEGLSEKDTQMFQYMEAYLNQLREPRYQLFKTQNMWTFLKLDTMTGQIWQVQYSVKGNEYRFETALDLNIRILTPKDQICGRFTLYPTENMYNFLLLDQIDGRCWQVQWSTEPNNRGVIPIN
jgi:hypothetical protein